MAFLGFQGIYAKVKIFTAPSKGTKRNETKRGGDQLGSQSPPRDG